MVITLGRHWRSWVLSSAIASVCPSARLSVRLSICPSRNFRYQPKIWWDDAQYHEADCYLKWPCSANFCAFHGTLKFSMIGLDQGSEGRHYRSNSLRISVTGLKFGGMMHNNMKQIVIWNGHARPIFVHSTELWNFQNRLGPHQRDHVTALAL